MLSTSALLLALPLFYFAPARWTDQWAVGHPDIPPEWSNRDYPQALRNLPRVSARWLCDQRRAKVPVFVIDVRSPQAYAAGHVPGAARLPMGRIRPARQELPTREPIVLYDDWPGEHYAANQVAYMRRNGMAKLDLRVLEGGFGAWRESGCEVATSDAL